jgi:putative transposase
MSNFWHNTFFEISPHFTNPGDKHENEYVESLNCKLKDGYLNMHWFSRLSDGREIIEAWRLDYNGVRPHRSVGGLSPVQYRKSKELKLAA